MALINSKFRMLKADKFFLFLDQNFQKFVNL